jgi:hypothetical protein
MADTTPYSTARQFMGTLPTWLTEADAERITAYKLYEDMYWNMPYTYELVYRGTENQAIYLPAPKTIIEATNRFLAVGWDFAVDPAVGTPADQELVKLTLTRLFKREQMWTKFATQKRFGLIRGDAVWHFLADPTKPEGSRISIYEVDPASYFPIYETDNLDKRIGCHLVDTILDDAGKAVIRRQTYRKVPETGRITTETTLWEVGKWDDREGSGQELKQVGIVAPLTELDPRITQIPVYHIRNFRTPGDPFGSSELRGLERISAAVNQAISDEELALALEGLGQYVTTSGPPTDADGNETTWQMGPGRVVEIDPESDFKRINGVSSVTANLDHIQFLLGQMKQGAGVPEIAAGSVDVAIAESGIALYLQLAPLLAKNAEKEQEMLSVYDHMLYDLTTMWLPTYEGVTASEIEIVSTVDDPMPVNRQAKIDELLQLFGAGVISAEYLRQELVELGYDFPAEMGEQIVAEKEALTKATNWDPFASRVASELTSE